MTIRLDNAFAMSSGRMSRYRRPGREDHQGVRATCGIQGITETLNLQMTDGKIRNRRVMYSNSDAL